MKKSILNVALLSMLFVLGACSVKDSNATPSSPSIADAQTQLGDLSGFTRYHRDDAGVEGGYKDATSANVYFNGTDKLSIASAVARTGEWTKNGQIVSGENVITSQDAETYTLTPNTTVTVPAELTGFKAYDATIIKDKKWDKKWKDNTSPLITTSNKVFLKVEGDTLIVLKYNGSSYSTLSSLTVDIKDLPRTTKFTKASI